LKFRQVRNFCSRAASTTAPARRSSRCSSTFDDGNDVDDDDENEKDDDETARRPFLPPSSTLRSRSPTTIVARRAPWSVRCSTSRRPDARNQGTLLHRRRGSSLPLSGARARVVAAFSACARACRARLQRYQVVWRISRLRPRRFRAPRFHVAWLSRSRIASSLSIKRVTSLTAAGRISAHATTTELGATYRCLTSHYCVRLSPSKQPPQLLRYYPGQAIGKEPGLLEKRMYRGALAVSRRLSPSLAVM